MKWLFKPRYSPFIMIIVLTCFLEILGLRIYKYEKHITKITQSPLPEISVAQILKTPYKTEEVYKKPYKFLEEDWFTIRIPVWEKVLEPFKNRPVNYLEIGVFQGRSLIWMLENILTDPNSKATAIDIFEPEYETTYRENLKLSGLENKVTTLKGYSQIKLRELPFDYFDIIYIDGSHAKADVLEDAVLSWRLVKPGGLIIFDDFSYGISIKHRKHFYCREAITDFAMCYDMKFEVIHNGQQLILRRKAGQ